MTEQLNVKAGDVVAILIRKGVEFIPNRLEKVKKVTAKQIHIGADYRYGLDGRPMSKYASGKLTDDPVIITELQTKIETVKREREAHQAQKDARDSRLTWQLANQITSAHDDTFGQNNSIERLTDLELLGEEYLQRILNDIEKAKVSANA